MRQKRLLIAGGGHGDIPMILAAKRLGFYVITTGNRPSDLGHKYSDEYVPADYSDRFAIKEIVLKKNIDYLCPSCNDFSAISCAYVAEELSLPGHDSLLVIETLHHKDLFREFCLENGISSPMAKGFINPDDAVEYLREIDYPVIIKPVDLTGGKGVERVDDFNSAIDAIKKSFEVSRAKRIVVEEFIDGTFHGMSTIIVDKKVRFYFYDNEHYYLNRYLVSGASAPGDVPQVTIDKIIADVNKISRELRLKDGIFHIQFVLKDSEPYILEVCRRPPGDLYVRFVELATGVDYSTYIIKSSCGIDISDISQPDKIEPTTRHCIMPAKHGILKEIIIDEDIRDNIIESMMWWQPGQVVSDILTQKFGIVFLKYKDIEEMRKKVDKLNDLIKVVVV